MARGVRKSQIAKKQLELQEVQQNIQQYEACLGMMKEKEAQLQEEIRMEECKEISELLRSKGLDVKDLKEMLSGNILEMEQSA